MNQELVKDKRFGDIYYVRKDMINEIISDFKKNVLEPSDTFKIDTIDGLGTTRTMLLGESNAKEKSADADILVAAVGDNREAVKILSDLCDRLGYDNFTSFGTIVSIAYPYRGKKYQIDVMISPSDMGTYEYMHKFKYWSDESVEPVNGVLIKGAHRSELVKSLVKAVGLSAAEKNFKYFEWNNQYKTTADLIVDLNAKVGRMRNLSKKEETLKFISILMDNYMGIDKLKSDLCDESNKLLSRFPPHPFVGMGEAYNLLIDLCFDKIDVHEYSWKETLDINFDTKDTVSQVTTFLDSMEFTKKLLDDRIIRESDIIGIFRDMKKSFNNGRANVEWSDEFVELVESYFPFLKQMI